MRITMESKVTEKKGLARATGQPYSIKEQQGYAYVADRDGVMLKHPALIVVPLADGQEAYPPGDYTLADSSFVVGEYGGLKVGRVKLEPVVRK